MSDVIPTKPRARTGGTAARVPRRDDSLRWRAVVTRRPIVGAPFVYAVRTTGVYCLPGCASRRPLRANVDFFDTARDAESAGYRACLRCHPRRPRAAEGGSGHAGAIVRACRRLDASPDAPSLAELAREAGLSATYFQRIFRRATGLSPKAYAAAARAERTRRAVENGGSITEAIYEAGFSSSGRFYEAAGAALGMSPSAYRRGGEATSIRVAWGRASLGGYLVAATDRGVVAVSLGDDPDALRRELEARFPRATFAEGDASFARLVREVVRVLDGESTGEELPLDLRGTAFQRRVFRALTRIPPGRTTSYAALATRLGAPRAARAVASACASNTLAVLVPCHRVVRRDGSLSGYRWGVERKRALLAREKGARPRR